MPLRLIVGPPGAGKTHRTIQIARDAASRGRRVAWIALPHQHDAVVRSLAAAGPTLGVEVMSAQRLMYRLLASARLLRPLVTGTERLASVGAALRETVRAVPSPGEARLFAAAVAEARRHGLGPDDLRRVADTLGRGGATDAAEIDRLAEVLAHYERSLAGRMDYDDVRSAAIDLLRLRARLRAAGPGAAEGGDGTGGGGTGGDGAGGGGEGGDDALTDPDLSEFSGLADLVVVDGFRELGALDLAFFDALAAHREVVLTLAEPPPGRTPDEVLPERAPSVRAHTFPNTVAEARWVLRALKAELARGVPADDLAVVAPPGAARALAALAEEFGVPLVDEAPVSLADTTAGHVLCELLELATYPTAARLLVVPDLVPLARLALERGVAGPEALVSLAAEAGLEDTYARLLARLAPTGDLERWAAGLVDLSLALAARLPGDDEVTLGGDAIRDLLLVRAQEAMRLGAPEAMPPWWAALVRASGVRRRQRAGVRVLDAALAAGRRFRTVFVVGASVGAYTAGEREDYFVPEDARRDPTLVLRDALAGRRVTGLPRRHRGGDARLLTELRARGDEVVVTVAEADRGGPLRPEPGLVAAADGAEGDVAPAPPLPAGSALEASGHDPYRPPGGDVADRTITIEALRRSDPCAFRVWAERLVPEGEAAAPPPLLRLRRALVDAPDLREPRRAELAAEHPHAAAWLSEHGEALARHAFGVRLPSRPAAPSVRLDAVERRGGVVRVVRFLAEDDEPEGVLDPRRRWTELYAARTLLRRAEIDEVRVVAWPVLGAPVEIEAGRFARGRGEARLERLAHEVDERWQRWRAGPAVPTPGRHCGRCPVRDLCREALG